MITKIYKDFEEFEAREDKFINGVSVEFAEKFPDYMEFNKTNAGCWECEECENCLDCSLCFECKYCKNCTGDTCLVGEGNN